MTAPLLPSLEKVNWDDLSALRDAADEAFCHLTADRWSLLLGLLDSLPQNQALTEMCETYDFMDKLIIHDDPQAGYRVRLHIFRPGYFDRPHNHRWSFASMIIAGSYLHTQYGADDGFESATANSLQPLHIHTERPGDWYVLHHTSVHSVRAQAGTVSLVLRGPTTKDAFRIIDVSSGESFHVRGAKDESPEERAAKRSTPQRLRSTIAHVKALRPTAERSTGITE